jgi:hypothetical protein
MENISQKTKQLGAVAKMQMKNMLNAMTTSENMVRNIVIFIIIIIIIGISLYISGKMSYEKTKCNDLSTIYDDMGKVASINPDGDGFKDYKLRDFYIKTAYNCCALGNFKNTFVSTCALEQVIRQGVRCLDFEIYSVHDKPVIAVSSLSSYDIKESFNSVDFSDAMNVVNNKAFSSQYCPNSNDPLILHFRIKSSRPELYKQMSDTLYQTLENRLLGSDYSYEFHGNNLGNIELSDLYSYNNQGDKKTLGQGKVIIIIDKSNGMFETTGLDEYVNIASNSVFMRALNNYDVKFTPDFSELIDFNKKNMTLSMPDLSVNDANVPASLHMKYGCQMVGMCYQNYDNNLEFYESFFAENGHAFVLKPENLRYVQVTIPAPTPQNPKLSYANRPVKSDYYSFNI